MVRRSFLLPILLDQIVADYRAEAVRNDHYPVIVGPPGLRIVDMQIRQQLDPALADLLATIDRRGGGTHIADDIARVGRHDAIEQRG